MVWRKTERHREYNLIRPKAVELRSYFDNFYNLSTVGSILNTRKTTLNRENVDNVEKIQFNSFGNFNRTNGYSEE